MSTTPNDPPVSTPLFEIDPSRVVVEQTHIGVIARLQPRMAGVTWRPAPARKLGFLIRHGNDLLGIIALTSPVITLECRDRHLGLPSNPSERGHALINYADMSVCVGAQPISWHWNLGKMLAIVATSLGDFWGHQYHEPLLGITTTSYHGRPSQYDRVMRFLGYTKGHGHVQVDDERFEAMVRWCARRGLPSPNWHVTNARMRFIAAYASASGESVGAVHGAKRGVYYAPVADPSTRPGLIAAWYRRWGLPRYERTRNTEAPYQTGVDYDSAQWGLL
uniref:Uncharacterized protein n=1 Tax=viral metagenome TaxID=1070528 RepID=A0A6H2A6H4_9ZZZZ